LPRKAARGRVLVVEDEALIAMMIEDLLADRGYRVAGPAASLRAAIACISSGGLDFALLDVNLGAGATSFALADALRTAGIPFAFITGYGPDGVRPDLRDVPVLTKPFDIAALDDLLAELSATAEKRV